MSDKIYDNQAGLTGAERGERKGYKILQLRFACYSKEKKELVSKFFTMFLTEENNERNKETLQLLGVEKPPDVVSHETVGSLNGLGSRTVDLVSEMSGTYENVKYINEPKFGTRVFDMREK